MKSVLRGRQALNVDRMGSQLRRRLLPAIALALSAFAFFIAVNAVRLSALAHELHAASAHSGMVRQHPQEGRLMAHTGARRACSQQLRMGSESQHPTLKPVRKRVAALPGRDIPLAHMAGEQQPYTPAPRLHSTHPRGSYSLLSTPHDRKWVARVHQKVPDPEETPG